MIDNHSTSARPGSPEFEAGLEHIEGGVMCFEVIGPVEYARLLLAGQAGDAQARAVIAVVQHFFHQVMLCGQGDTPVLCLCCETSQRKMTTGSVALVTRMDADLSAEPALALWICPACERPDGLNARVMAGLRWIWPDMREIVISHAGGHA